MSDSRKDCHYDTDAGRVIRPGGDTTGAGSADMVRWKTHRRRGGWAAAMSALK